MRMKLRGSLIVIICCFLLQFSNLTQKRYMFSLGNSFSNIIILCFQGLIFLVYPLLCHLADAYLTRYRMLKCGVGIIITGGIILFLWVLFTAIINLNITHVISENGQYALGCLFDIGVAVGLGLFEANAIQFGLDQLLEAPTPKLITFIHWYYWSQNVGKLVVFYNYYLGNFAILEVCIMSVKFGVEKKQFYR